MGGTRLAVVKTMELQVETGLSSRPQLDSNDRAALTSTQQSDLNKEKVKVRLQNEKYFRKHPEIPLLLESFLQKVLLKKPDDIKAFAASYFTDPRLREIINLKLSERQNEDI
uniref:RIIa domain-containing protein n=1 Tax=Amphimedon queenslandica TaxID=400682 RepID=A0A1X7T2K7_AMPQE